MKTNILSVGLAATVVFAASFAQAFAGVTTTSYQPYQAGGSAVYNPYAVGYNNEGVYEANQNQYQYQNQNQGDLYVLLQSLLAQLRDLQRQVEDRDYNDDSEVDIETGDVDDVEDDRATIEGEIDLNDSDYAYVWFEYGEDRYDLDEETSKLKLRRDDDFSSTLRNLDEDETYYYRAMAEDEDGEETRGDIESFRTDGDSSDEDEPDVSVDSADDVNEDSAEISGDVDMNDFRNGVVFFVYGEDEDQVEDVADDFDSYSDVDEDGEDLQKVRVDSDLDNDEDYTRTIAGLDDDTMIYFALCVEYEDEDDDNTIVCSSIRDFETDRD